jgi:hypothetical protein
MASGVDLACRHVLAALRALRPVVRDAGGDDGLREHYDALAGAARELLPRCPAFARACARCGWLQAQQGGGVDPGDLGMAGLLDAVHAAAPE